MLIQDHSSGVVLYKKNNKNQMILFIFLPLVFSVAFWRHIKEFHKHPEWSTAKVYLFEDKTHNKARDPCSSVCAESWKLNPAEKGTCKGFSSALRVHQTMPKMGWYLKGYWLKFSQLHSMLNSVWCMSCSTATLSHDKHMWCFWSIKINGQEYL